VTFKQIRHEQLTKNCHFPYGKIEEYGKK